VRPAEIDETPLDGESPEGYVLRLAEEKALRSATVGRGEPIQGDPDGREVVLAADTTVVLDGAILGKPEDRADARRMLERLSGRDHEVLTGVAVCDLHRGFRRTAVESTRVRFAELEPEEVEWYVGTGEPLDKAGAYAVQGVGALFVDRLEGSYSNVVGLPLPTTYRLLLQAGYPLLALSRRP